MQDLDVLYYNYTYIFKVDTPASEKTWLYIHSTHKCKLSANKSLF